MSGWVLIVSEAEVKDGSRAEVAQALGELLGDDVVLLVVRVAEAKTREGEAGEGVRGEALAEEEPPEEPDVRGGVALAHGARHEHHPPRVGQLGHLVVVHREDVRGVSSSRRLATDALGDVLRAAGVGFERGRRQSDGLGISAPDPRSAGRAWRGGGARARIVPARFPSRSRKARGGRARRHPSLRRRRCSPRNQLATSGDEAAKARFPPAPSHGDLTAGMEPEQLQKSRVRQFSEYCRLLAIRKHAFSSLLAAARRDSPRRGAARPAKRRVG